MLMWNSSALTPHGIAEIERHVSANELELLAGIDYRHCSGDNVTINFPFDKLHTSEECVTC